MFVGRSVLLQVVLQVFMKVIKGQAYRKEGKERERLYTVIECLDCGATTYERKKDKVLAALNRGCRSCPRKNNK